MYLCGAETSYLSDIVSGNANPLAYIMRYGILSDELPPFIARTQNLGPRAHQMLIGLLRTKSIFPVDVTQISPSPIPITSVRSEYFGLATKCNMKFIHDLPLSPADEQALSNQGISAFHKNHTNYFDVIEIQQDNILLSVNLTEGGNASLSDHILKYSRNCSEIKIFDHFFNTHSMGAFVNFLNDYTNQFGQMSANICIYVGMTSNADIASFSTTLAPLTTGTTRIERVVKTPAYAKRPHDRYIQIDDAYTATFTAGIDCYVLSGGLNRACSVTLKSVLAIYDVIELQDLTGNIIKFRY